MADEWEVECLEADLVKMMSDLGQRAGKGGDSVLTIGTYHVI